MFEPRAPERRTAGSRGRWLLCLTLLLSLGVTGCGDAGETVTEEDRQQIRETLENYLPALAEAYATGNIEVLRPWAAEKELAVVHKKVQDLMVEENRVVEPTLEGFEIEDITMWNYSNVFVTTLETWDLQVLASGTDVVTSQVDDQRDRVKYQMKRRDDGWMVLYRQIEQTFDE